MTAPLVSQVISKFSRTSGDRFHIEASENGIRVLRSRRYFIPRQDCRLLEEGTQSVRRIAVADKVVADRTARREAGICQRQSFILKDVWRSVKLIDQTWA